jgi:hypothetical protein
MIGLMESVHYDQGDSADARSGMAAALSGAGDVPASVGELTERQLDLQRRLVRESLLLRPA